KISVTKRPAGGFSLTLGDQVVVVDEAALKDLLLKLTQVLLPETPSVVGSTSLTREFLNRVKAANDIAVQTLLRLGDHKDLVALLKVAEADAAALDKLHRNMTPKARTVFAEDLEYTYKSGADMATLDAAVGRLWAAVREMERKGRITFGG
ncbi:MAG: hypothetical protein FJX57_11220, partial [Alphaproteobacteria bacterium]|nr:hypothetical protein [Alphaproteobacteria bacterium]